MTIPAGVRERELQRARMLMRLERFEELESILARLAAARPDDREVQLLLAQVRHVRGDADFARSLRRAAGRAGAAPGTRAMYADVLRRSGKNAVAESILRALIAQYGRLPPLLNSLATVLQELGQFAEAAGLAGAAYDALPEDPAVAETYVACLISTGDAARALPIVERYLSCTPRDQRWITYRLDIARQSGHSLHGDWCDLTRLVQTFDLPPPKGYRTQDEFQEQMLAVLAPRHLLASHPLDLTLHGGSRSLRGLLNDPDPLLRQFFAMLTAPLAEYVAALGRDERHPMLARNGGLARLTDCWSAWLRRGGFHSNHIHSRGWISSAYYVAVPEDSADRNARNGWLKFGQPLYPMPGGEPLLEIQPRPGRLVLFPSYLWHGTRPLSGDQPRVAIAFDCLPHQEPG